VQGFESLGQLDLVEHWEPRWPSSPDESSEELEAQAHVKVAELAALLVVVVAPDGKADALPVGQVVVQAEVSAAAARQDEAQILAQDGPQPAGTSGSAYWQSSVRRSVMHERLYSESDVWAAPLANYPPARTPRPEAWCSYPTGEF